MFDLNIEKILEAWDVCHAIREVIANAIDEEMLSCTKPIEIREEAGRWIIRDFGRGLQYEHLTEKENVEKLSHHNVIGRFGIGLKDALATFDRRGIAVEIESRHCRITLGHAVKHDFEDILTLHAYVELPSDTHLEGTKVILTGVKPADMALAKQFFLRFSGDARLDITRYGEILQPKGGVASIYINGVRVAQEPNFMFSYNITSVTASVKKALNRERTNVGRSAYSERIKDILLSSDSNIVASQLARELERYELGTIHDEAQWLDVSEHACRILNAAHSVVFFTPGQITAAPRMVDEARASGAQIVTVPETLANRIHGLNDVAGNPIRDFPTFQSNWNESFQFSFVPTSQLNPAEQAVYKTTTTIIELLRWSGRLPTNVRTVVISEKMRSDPATFREADGLWDSTGERIIIKRSCLQNLDVYAGTLLHEIAHARCGASDVTTTFENELTLMLGGIMAHLLNSAK